MTSDVGLNVRTSIAILNCLLARQLCFEDASCSAILEIIPRVCGSELVACSTVTVTKCQAALRTLQAFPFFKPTCLCKEPNVDPECNSFRDFLFDHPCVFVLKKEKDPYPVEALPTCNYALNVCHSEKSCAALFDTFKLACRARDGDCKMDDKDQCREAWAGLRMSPLFGCICPNNHMKKRCDRIFAMVNHNPCVETRRGRNEPDMFLERLQRLRHNPTKKPTLATPTERHPDKFNLHPSKLPDNLKKIPHHHSGKNQRILSLEYKSNVTRYVAPDGTILLVTENGTQIITDAGGGDLIRAIIKAMGQRSRNHATASASRRHPNVSRNRINSVNAVSQDGKRLPPSIASGNNNKTSYGTITTDSNQNKQDNLENNWVSGVDLGPEEGFELDDHHISPHIMEEGHRRMFGRPGRRKGGTHHWKLQDGPKRIGSNDEGHEGGPRISLKSTCQLALDRCIRDKSCTASLTPILQTCDTTRCDREGCMESLRNFYRTPNVQWNLEIAFCLCKKTDNKEDACMNAQEKLHPVCAQREPGAHLPYCHVLAQTCRENQECRTRLEMYEQSCAVDSVTKRCAGSPEACRSAVLNMLGTDLRTACACKGTEFNHLYECLGWQRLLWLNPCVVESQSDFHIKTYGSTSTPAFDNGIRTIHEISSENGGKYTTSIMIPQTTTTIRQPSVVFVTAPPKTAVVINTHEETKIGRNIEVEIVQGNKEQEPIIVVPELTTIKPTTTTTEEPTTTVIITTPSTTTTTEMETTTRTTTTSTTPEPIKYCIVQRPELDDQFVQKGHTKRLYRDAELDCSELCHCDNHLSVSCHAVCVRHAPCRTALAFYSHAAPAYQAYRGRCYCYSGSFICMRPNPGEYSLPPGVYLLLGFSSQDEALLRPHTRLGLEDAVRVLQEYMLTITDDGTNCTLALFNVTNENMIITASVPNNQRDTLPNTPMAILDNDKEECIGLLETLKSKINSQDYDISSHLLLSIFKIAEVDIIYPPPSSAAIKGPSLLLIMTATFIIYILQEKNIDLLHIFMHNIEKLCTNISVKLYNILVVGSKIDLDIFLRTYNVIPIALETNIAHVFYFSRDFAFNAMIFFHFFLKIDNYDIMKDKNKIINTETTKINFIKKVMIHFSNGNIKKWMPFCNASFNKMAVNIETKINNFIKKITFCFSDNEIKNWAPFRDVSFNKMAVSDFIKLQLLSKVMPFARLFYDRISCFVYTVIGIIIPRTHLLLIALRKLIIDDDVVVFKHIMLAVKNFMYYLYFYNILSVEECNNNNMLIVILFCSRNVHLESMTYSIHHTIFMSLLTTYYNYYYHCYYYHCCISSINTKNIVANCELSLFVVVNFAVGILAAYTCQNDEEISLTILFTFITSFSIKTDILLSTVLLMFIIYHYHGFVTTSKFITMGVQKENDERIKILTLLKLLLIKLMKLNCLQCIFLNNVLQSKNYIIIKNLILIDILFGTTVPHEAILSMLSFFKNKMACFVIFYLTCNTMAASITVTAFNLLTIITLMFFEMGINKDNFSKCFEHINLTKASNTHPIDHVILTKVNHSNPIEHVSLTRASYTHPFDHITLTKVTHSNPIEHVSLTRASYTHPFDYATLTKVNHSNPIEHVYSTRVSYTHPIEHVTLTNATHTHYNVSR